MVNDPICMLAIEEKPNSFLPINLYELNLGLTSNLPLTLSELDQLIIFYGIKNLLDIINNNNILPIEACSDSLIILYEEKNGVKRKLTVISEEIVENYSFASLVDAISQNKNSINHLVNILNCFKINDFLKNELIFFLKKGLYQDFVSKISELPYFFQRKLFLHMIASINKSAVRVREKNSEEKE